MKTLTNYVNSDWEVRMPTSNEATVAGSNDSKREIREAETATKGKAQYLREDQWHVVKDAIV